MKYRVRNIYLFKFRNNGTDRFQLLLERLMSSVMDTLLGFQQTIGLVSRVRLPFFVFKQLNEFFPAASERTVLIVKVRRRRFKLY